MVQPDASQPESSPDLARAGARGATSARWVALFTAFTAAAVAALPVRGPAPAHTGSGAPTTTLGLAALPIPGGVPLVDLGSEFGPFEVTARSSWAEFEGGSVALLLHLRALDLPGAGLSGTVHLRAPVPLRSPSQADRLLMDPREALAAAGADGPGGAPEVERGADGSVGYAALESRLLGGGALEGLRLELTRLPESIIRRGAWADGEGGESPDAVFGHFRWRLLGDLDAATGLPRTGAGTLAFQLESEGR